MKVLRYLAERGFHAAITWLVAVSLVFLAMRVIPGNPLVARFGQHPDAVQIEKLKRENGWDRPLPSQLVDFFWKLFTTGDLGKSIARSGSKINDEIKKRTPATIELTLGACLLAIPLGVGVGSVAAFHRGRFLDYGSSFVSLLGVSLPVFFLAIVAREAIPFLPTSRRLPADVIDFDPITGLYTIDTLMRGRLDLFWKTVLHLALPSLVLSTIPMAIIAKLTRTTLLDFMTADFVRTARAKGASWTQVLFRHLLPNVAIPLSNVAALQVGLLLSGAVLTETVFSWPGLGKYLAEAVVSDKDYAAAQAGAIVIATFFCVLNLLLDVLFLWLDPRLRTLGGSTRDVR